MAVVNQVAPEVIKSVLAVANAGSTAELKRLIGAHRDVLFTDSADEVFAGLISQQQNSEHDIAHLRGRRTLVAMCREYGIDAAFERDPSDTPLTERVMAFLNIRDIGELKAFVVEHESELLSPDTEAVFRHLSVQYRDDANILAFLEERRQLLATCRDHGTSSAFADDIIQVEESLGNAVAAFMQATSPAQLKAILARDGQHLLTNAAEELMGFIQSGVAASDPDQAAHMGRRLALLRRCRLYGVDQALDTSAIASTLGANPREGDAAGQASATQHVDLQAELQALAGADGGVDEAGLKALLGRRPELSNEFRQAIERGDVQWAPPADRSSYEAMIADVQVAELSGDWERVISSGVRALKYSEVDHDPRASVMIHSALGTALSKTQRGDRAANLDRSIHHHRQAQAGLRAGEAAPERELWTMNEHHLALALFQRVRGDRAQNIEAAIEIWRGLLASAGEGAQVEWKISLADALRTRFLGDRAKNLTEAREILTTVVADAGSQINQTFAAHARVNLGLVWLVRPDGDPAANVERAIDLLASGLGSLDPRADIGSWSNVHRSLARAYMQRMLGDPAENWLTAVDILRKVADACPKDDYPELWAEVRLEMASILADGPDGRTIDKILEAVGAMESVLEVYTRTSYPDRWAKVQLNIGATLLPVFVARDDLVLADRAQNHVERSLTVYSREGSPERWANAHQLLGRLHMHRAELSEDVRAAEAGAALQHFERALEARTIAVNPEARLDTLSHAGAIRFHQREWDEALALFVDGMRTSDQLLGAAFTEDARLAGVAPTGQFYRSAAYCLEKLNDPTAALVCLDWGKGRRLAEALAVQDLDRFQLSAGEIDQITSLRDEVRRFEYAMRSAGNASPQEFTELGERLQGARAALAQTVAAATIASELFNQTRLTPEQLFDAVPLQGALVVPLITAVGTTVFLLIRTLTGELEIIRLALNDATGLILREAVVGRPDHPGWWRRYNAWRKGEISTSAWNETITSTMDVLWNVILGPVLQTLDSRLPPDAAVTIAPHGDLAFLPFHAAGPGRPGEPGLLDRFTIAYIPSLYALHTCQQRAVARRGAAVKVVAAVNPTRDLPFSDGEADGLSNILPANDLTVLRGSDAAKQQVEALVAGATHLHLACHGQHDRQDIMRSGLLLSDGVLTLNAILGDALDLDTVRLVTLSACDSGLNDLGDSADEFIGLPAAFLEGGACGVLSTLWPVADRATSLLIRRFYKAHLTDGLAPARALRESQLWLKNATVSDLAEFYLSQEGADTLERQEAFLELTLGGGGDERPYQAPYYWAAFQYTGV